MSQPTTHLRSGEATDDAGKDSDDDDDDRCPVTQVSGSFSCPNETSRWQHLNVLHISRLTFPPSTFLENHGRKVCSTCGFVLAGRWKFCRRSQGSGRLRCRGLMVLPSESKWASKMVSKTSPPHVTKTDAQATADVRSNPQDLVLEGVKAASHNLLVQLVYLNQMFSKQSWKK